MSYAKGFPKTISQKAFAKLPEKEAYKLAEEYSITLKNNGINFVFAPVVDLEINITNPVIAKLERSFSDDPKIVTQKANYLIDAYTKEHIACSLKHFPGHGSSAGDSHLGFVDVTNTWKAKELEPYRNILLDKNNLGVSVMTAHVVNKNLDESGLPATLSKKTINILRENYKFKGIVVSDDLQMQAITKHFNLQKTLKLAILAGNDLLIFGNQLQYDPDIAKKSIVIIKQLIEDKEISEDRVKISYQKIVNLKNWLG